MTEPLHPQVSEQWFKDYSVGDPAIAWERWLAWLSLLPAGKSQQSQHSRLYRKALALAAGISDSAVSHYLNQRDFKLSEETLRTLDALSLALGTKPPNRPSGDVLRVRRGARRIVLLTELTNLPSLRYHFQTLQSIVQAGQRANLSVIVHELPPSGQAGVISRVLRSVRPDGVIVLRLSPELSALEVLRRYAEPVVLVHAHRLKYPAPVLGNIVPEQRAIEPAVRMWASQLPKLPELAREPVVVVAIDDEIILHPLEPYELGVTPSIRNELKVLIERALAELNPRMVRVEDYSFRHALRVYQENPNARAFVCLNDEIAVGIKHILQALGQDRQHPILALEVSELARAENISSISQDLREIGEMVAELFATFFRENPDGDKDFPEFRQLSTEVKLTLRDGPGA